MTSDHRFSRAIRFLDFIPPSNFLLSGSVSPRCQIRFWKGVVAFRIFRHTCRPPILAIFCTKHRQPLSRCDFEIFRALHQLLTRERNFFGASNRTRLAPSRANSRSSFLARPSVSLKAFKEAASAFFCASFSEGGKWART